MPLLLERVAILPGRGRFLPRVIKAGSPDQPRDELGRFAEGDGGGGGLDSVVQTQANSERIINETKEQEERLAGELAKVREKLKEPASKSHRAFLEKTAKRYETMIGRLANERKNLERAHARTKDSMKRLFDSVNKPITAFGPNQARDELGRFAPDEGGGAAGGGAAKSGKGSSKAPKSGSKKERSAKQSGMPPEQFVMLFVGSKRFEQAEAAALVSGMTHGQYRDKVNYLIDAGVLVPSIADRPMHQTTSVFSQPAKDGNGGDTFDRLTINTNSKMPESLPETPPAPKDTPEKLYQKIAEYQQKNPNQFAPLDEMHKAIGGNLTPGQFEDVLREMSKDGSIRLHPYTRPAYTMSREMAKLTFFTGGEAKGFLQVIKPPTRSNN